MTEKFTTQGMNAWLDSPAGEALTARLGSREAARGAIYAQEEEARKWRRERAVERAERSPGRWPSIDDAMVSIPEPAGGGGTWITGSTQEVVDMFRRVNPATAVRSLGEETPEPMAPGAVSIAPDGSRTPADFRAPHQRD